MSIENPNVIDFVSIDRDENVVLTISDHLKWDADNEHLLLLQNKMNSYLGAIESGELVREYPKAYGRRIVISLVAMFTPNPDGHILLERVKETLERAGYAFRFEQEDLED